MQLKIVTLISLACISCTNSYTEADVDYYERLIKEELWRASIYQQPNDAKEYEHTNSEPVYYGEYDFIVIGSGSGGSVAAARLSEVSTWRVLLLEAGGEETDFTRIPSMFSPTLNLEYDWGLYSAPQNTCSLSTGGVFKFPRGKLLGGSSAVNCLIYSRGNKLDYDNWEAEGNAAWSYKYVLYYFMKSENALFPGQIGYHGSGGPLTVEYNYPSSKKLDIFLEANIELGVPILDYNGEHQLGANKVQRNTIHGSRMSSARAFLEPAANRSNLEILTGSYVTKILISNSSKQAFGVLFSRGNIQYMAKVTKEVILSAGVVGSPQLLLLSGIGPADHLNQLNIPVIQDLAVGKNLHDHLVLFDLFTFTYRTEPSFSLRSAIKQYLNGIGPFTENSQGIGFYRINLEQLGIPEVEILMNPSVNYEGFNPLKSDNLLDIRKHLNKTDFITALTENNIFQFCLILLHPKTRGSIYLKSSDPYEFPVIDSKCLDDPDNDDLSTLVKALDIIMKLLRTKSFKSLSPVIVPYPPCSAHTFLSEQYFECLIKQTARNALHAAGTCKMGPDPSKGAVVDHTLKVYGIDNVRIADASVVPFPISAHMSAPSMMIGERVADISKLKYKII